MRWKAAQNARSITARGDAVLTTHTLLTELFEVFICVKSLIAATIQNLTGLKII